MIYIYFEFDAINYWIEIDAQGTAYRQITHQTFPDDIWEISCIHDNLADQTVEIDELVSFISAEDFEAVWQSQLSHYMDRFQRGKSEYPIGASVIGTVKMIYPQGVLVSINDYIALASYQRLEDSCISAGEIYAGQTVHGKILAYDEQNLWLLLDEETVLKK
ncbi:hypothetical protein [Enterococcus sp. BWR-S5]|uniref:hypothetical protein n=1 Tax=Enterococcus sp. BWR-S5 TaxID=2787714 RepID=UPI0019249B7D|nr:hypothetical protein [Enterococcus sp. BWR-S5]MBL1225092.1 hypothetical protein [Enterococcus sp. BWR-S5]